MQLCRVSDEKEGKIVISWDVKLRGNTSLTLFLIDGRKMENLYLSEGSDLESGLPSLGLQNVWSRRKGSE